MALTAAEVAAVNVMGRQMGIYQNVGVELGDTISAIESTANSVTTDGISSAASVGASAYLVALSAQSSAASAASQGTSAGAKAVSAASSAASADSKAESATLLAKSAQSSAASADSKGESATLLAKSAASSAASAASQGTSCGLWNAAWTAFGSVITAGSIAASGASVAKASYATEGNVISLLISRMSAGGNI